jgi:hypothetical protein
MEKILLTDHKYRHLILSKEEIMKQLHRILRPFCLRRTKNDIDELDIPPMKELILKCGRTLMQKQLQLNLIKHKKPIVGVPGEANNRTMLHRQTFCHPYLLVEELDEWDKTNPGHLIKNCGKMILLDRLLKLLKPAGHRCIIFSQFTMMLNILEDYCDDNGFQYMRLDGSTSLDERDELVAECNKKNLNGEFCTEKFLFLISTKAGGLGLTLIGCDTVIIYDSDWNPQNDLQAMARTHRVGQTKPVKIYRLITRHSVEELIMERQYIKLKWDFHVIHKMKDTNSRYIADKLDFAKLSKKEQNELMKYGAETIHIDIEDANDNADTLEELNRRGEENQDELKDQMVQRFAQFQNLDDWAPLLTVVGEDAEGQRRDAATENLDDVMANDFGYFQAKDKSRRRPAAEEIERGVYEYIEEMICGETIPFLWERDKDISDLLLKDTDGMTGAHHYKRARVLYWCRETVRAIQKEYATMYQRERDLMNE